MSPTTLEMAGDFASIRVLGDWLRTSMHQLGIDGAEEGFVGPIELAVHELATNCIDHARAQKITVEAAVSAGALTIRVVDDGSLRFDAAQLERAGRLAEGKSEGLSANAEPQVRGYGLMIVEQVAQSIHYERTDDTNTWELTFLLAS